jgi:methionine sulfoxide reductase heme-binding subunit
MPARAAAREQILYPWLDRSGQFSWLKMSVFIGILLPGAWAVFIWAFGQPAQSSTPSPLGNVAGGTNAMPVTAALHLIGLWSVRFLLITLAITPLRRIGGWPRLVTFRRMIGVAAFAYVAIHFTLYVVQQNYRLIFVATEILLRIYLTIGFVTLLGLLVLALTSTDSAMRRLGGKRWQRLHYLVYPLTMLGLAHFFMQSKINVSEPVLMSGLFLWLMLYRAAYRWNGERAWYQFATGIGGERIWKAAFDLSHLRPFWWVLLGGAVLVGLKIAADRLWNQRKARQKADHLAAKAI